MVATEELVGWLKAVGEPTRLRILRLCSSSELSGSDLARVLHQSEPRVAHHLKVLTEAGLLRRVRQGQWVQYGIARARLPARFIGSLLVQVDASDPLLLGDQQGAASGQASGASVNLSESRLGRALYGFVAADWKVGDIKNALVIGVGHLELLEGVASSGCACTAVAGSRRAAQAARAFVERRGLHARVIPSFVAADREAPASFDAVLVDHLAAPQHALPVLLMNARRSLRREGRVWLFERYEALESHGDAGAEHPLARMRRELRSAGFDCKRLMPIEADGEHVLAASAA